MKIKCLIVDDEPLSQEIMETYIRDFPGVEWKATCNNALEALDCLRRETIDLIFLDINMPALSGISFLQSITSPPHIVFTTAYPEYAIEGFELNAVDYLVKPFSFERFVRAVNKVREKMEAAAALTRTLTPPVPEQRYIVIKSDKKLFKLDFEEISYFNSLGDYVKVVTRPGKVIITAETLKHIGDSLPDTHFIRVHKSYIVSIGSIRYIEGNHLVIGDTAIPIGLTYREDLINRFNIQF